MARTAPLILNDIKAIQRELRNLTDVPNLVSKYPGGLNNRQIQSELNRYRIMYNSLINESLRYFESYKTGDEFNKEFNKLRTQFGKSGIKIDAWKGKPPAAVDQIKGDMAGQYMKGETLQTYSQEQRLNMVNRVIGVEKDYQSIDKTAKAMPGSQEMIYNQRQTAIKRLFEQQKPRSTLLEQTRAFNDQTKTEFKQVQSTVKRQVENANRQMLDELRISMEKGETFRKRIGRVGEVTKQYFPGDKIPIVGKDGKVRNYPADAYNNQWVRYGRTRSRSLGTLSGMQRANMDIVEWMLVGENHTDECLSMELQKYFSITGTSDNYPALPAAPPIHINCKSRIEPAPQAIQERANVTKADTDEIKDAGMLTEKQVQAAVNAQPTDAKTIPFTPAKTIKEAEEWAVKNGLANKVDYSQFKEVSTANNINDEFVKLQNEYRLPNKIDEIKSAKIPAYARVNIYQDSTKTKFEINPIIEYETQGINNFYKIYNGKDFIKVDDNNRINALVSHEFAHDMVFSKTANPKIIEEIKDVRKKWLTETNKLARNGKIQEIIDKNIYISDNARKNIDEFIAETFSDYRYGSNPSKYSIQVGKIIDREYKK